MPGEVLSPSPVDGLAPAEAMDPAFAALFAAQAAAAQGQPRPPPGALPAALVRAGYRQQRAALDPPPALAVTARDLKVPGADGPLDARLYSPQGDGVTGLLVYFHGGGFVLGDLETHDSHCRRLAATSGHRVLAVDYRLAPEHPFPAAHDDALAVTRWAFDACGELNADPRRLGVGGDSAGANLAASVALDLVDDPIRRLALQLLLYPVTWPGRDTASRQALDGPVLSRAALTWFRSALAADGHVDAHRALIAGRDVEGAPRTLVVTAGFDPLKDEGRAFAEHLLECGVSVEHVEYPSLVHDFYVMAGVSPAVCAAVCETGAWLAAGFSTGRP